ncbi:hypothetical protein JTB14_003010 [Gonioctena quinquepunctata]|nr:hypothetical protein JTB14_003010 [Gonioctena quinquepunctata]
MLRSSLVEPLPISEPPETKPVIEKVVVLIHDEPKTKQNKISLDESEDIDEAICEEEKITPPRSLRSQKLNETISGDINTEKGKVQEKCAKKKSDVQKDRPKAVAKAAIKGKRPILKIHQLKGGKMKQRKNIKPSRSLRSGVKTEKTKNKLEKTKKMKQKLSQPVKKLKRRAAASVSKKESLASKRRAVKLRKTAIVKNKKASKKEKPVDIIENIIQEIRNTLFKGNCEEQELQIKEENSPKENVSPGTKKPVKRLKMSEAPNRKKKARRASLKEIKNFKNTKSNAAETKQGNKRVENAKKRKAVDKKTSEITRRESRRVADKKTVKTEEDSASTNPNPNEIVKPGLSEEKLEQGKTIVQSKNQESVSKETMKENNHDAKVEVHSRKEIYQMVNSYLEEINDESHGDKLKRKSEEHSVDAKRQCKKKMLSKSVPVPEVVQAVPTKTIVSSDVKSIAREIKEETAIVVKEQVQSMEIPEDFPENSDPMSVEELEILRQTLQGIEAKRQTTKTFNRFVFIVNEMLRNEQSSSNLMSLDNQDKESKEPVLPEYAGVKGYQNYRAQDVVNLVDGKFDKKGLRVVNTMNTLIPSREVVGTIKQQCPVNNRIESAIISLKPVDITPAEIPAPPERLERRTDITVFDFDESEPEITPLRHKVSPIVDKSSSPTKALPWSSTEPQEKKPPKEKVKTERVRRNKATPVAPETGTVIDLDGTKRKLWSRIENPVPTDMKPPPPPPPRSEPGRNQEVVEEPPNSPTKATSPMKQPTIIEMFKMVRLKMECPGTSAVSGSGVDEGPVVSRDGSVVNLKRQVFGEAMPPPLKPEKLNYKAEGLEDEDSDCESRAEWVPEEYAEYKMKYSAQKMMRVKQIHQCKFCMKIYPTYYQLVKHKREHEKTENPYMCPECQAVFNNVEDFSAHLRGHRGKYPYTCHKCDLGFWTKSAFDAHKPIHILRKMKPSPKKFRCDICAKEFAKLCDIDRHSRVHTGEKPFVCNICNKRFQQAHNLSKHLLIHLHLKPFQCEICNKQFGRIDVLTRHLLTHSLDKPFKCSVCGKSFIRQLQLNQHREKRHPSEPPKTEPPEGLRDGGGGAAREVRGVEAQ